MPAWLPILKASLPYITQIVTTAVPAFTSRPSTHNLDPVIARQIEELQAAATKNAESIHVLAEKLQQTIEGIDSAAAALQKQLVFFKIVLFLSLTVAAGSAVVAYWALSQ